MNGMEKSYHHGNLREALLEEGIEMICEGGMAQFSLRKLAKRVGVSPTACYNHFENADSLLRAMREYVTDKFSQALFAATELKEMTGEGVLAALRDFGAAYVAFFAQNPHYFSFLFDAVEYHITLTDKDFYGDYEPFRIFREFAMKCFGKLGLPEERYSDTLVAMWAMVHGLAAMANMKGFSYESDWAELTRRILLDHFPSFQNGMSQGYRE